MKKAVLVIYSLVLCHIAMAQSDHLVTLKKDTLKGEIKILSYDIQDRVQIAVDKKKKMFNALEILYASVNGEIYKPVQYANSIRMMKLLKEGFINLYAFKPDNQNMYDGRYLVKRDGTGMEVPNLTFKKSMSDYLEDCESVAKKIKDGEYLKKDIEKIVEDYNLCISSGNTASTAPVDPGKKSKTESITDFTKKVAAQEFSSRNDALELLKDIQGKVDRGENVPNYQIEALKSLLATQSALQTDLEKLIAVLKEGGK